MGAGECRWEEGLPLLAPLIKRIYRKGGGEWVVKVTGVEKVWKKGVSKGLGRGAGAAGVGWYTERRMVGEGGHADLFTFL